MVKGTEQPPGETNQNTLIKKTFKLLKKGEKKIKLKNQFKNIILVIGDTGNGKTIFTRWIAGDNSKLSAEEVLKGHAEYVINIRGRRSSTLTSDTIYPTLVVDTETNVPYYDCPGFKDFRSTSNEIAATYFIKKIVNFADCIKIILIVNYSSVRPMVERHNFKDMLKAVTNSLKNIEKFRNSIALVVTKVDYSYIKRRSVFVDDTQVISLIAAFLEEIKQELANVQDSSIMEKRLYEDEIKLISYLLTKDGEEYAKIGIFRRPDDTGPLCEFPLLQEEKCNIKRIIYKNLTFTEAVDDDFGYTISDTSRYNIGRFINVITERVELSIGRITEEVIKHYGTLTNQIRKNIKEFGNIDSLPDTDNFFPVESSHLRRIQRSTSNLINDVENVTSPYELAQKINKFVTDSEIGVSRCNILNIENQGKYFNFLQVVSEVNLNTRSWDEPFRRVLTSLSEHWENLQEDINSVAPKIHTCILSCFDLIAKDLKNQMDKKISVLEIQEVHWKLNDYRQHILWLLEKCQNDIKINEFLKIIHDATRCIMINVPNGIALNIIKLENYLKYLQTFNEMITVSSSSSWMLPFQNIALHLKNSKNWYKFLDSLYHTLTEYELQKNKNIYNVADIENWGQSYAPQGITITNSNFQKFLQKISEHGIAKLEKVRKLVLNEMRLEEINQIMNLTLKRQINIHRSERLIFIKDEYITITDFMKDSINPNAFSSILKAGIIKHVKMICIFASRTIFIDGDLTLPGLSLGIIAPKWEIIGKRKINLDGADGVPHSKQKADTGSSDGEDGEPGSPGKPGGTFFGIGAIFVNGSSLTITANGGNGAPGQHGGDGKKGERGVDAEMPTSDDSPNKDEIVKGLTSFRGFKCKKIGGKGWITSKTFDVSYEISGHSGGRGGNGGNGGKGLEGGNAGVVNLYELDKKSGITKHSKQGKCGIDGKGGQKGPGGERGDVIIAGCYIKCPCCLDVFFDQRSTIEWTRIKTMHFTGKGGDDGSKGTDGANRRGLQSPEPANTISDPFKIVNEYKKYLIKNFNCRFKRSSLVLFFNKLNENNSLKNIYNTVGLIEEFQMIEEEYSRFPLEQSHFIPIYGSMLIRISDHAQGMKSSEDFGAHLKVLNYLYTTILSKISILSGKTQAHLTLDLVRYLDIVNGYIVNPSKLHISCQNAFIIKQKEDFYCNFIKRAEEVQSVILEHILPDINSIGEQIDNDIHLLIETTIHLQHHTQREDYLIMEQEKLENSWALLQVFCNLKLIARVVSFLSIVGVSAGPVIEAAISVRDSLTFYKKRPPSQEDPNLINFLQVVENGISNLTYRKLSFLMKLLRDLSDETKNYPEPLQDLVLVIEGIKSRIYNPRRKSLRLREIKTLESDLKLELKGKEEMLRSEKGDQKSMDALQVISRLSKIIELGSLVVNIGRDDKDETSKLSELTIAIEHADKKFLSLKQYEENIYNSIDKIIENMENNILNTGIQKEPIYLDVTKWQVQSSLKNIQLQMKGLFERFKVQDNMAHCFDMLQEAMTTLIDVYDHVENHLEQQTLTSYIREISSISAQSINVVDQRFVGFLNHLNIALKSNLILKSYKSALDAFNKWVFPFSKIYITDPILSQHFRFERNIENLVANCVAHIEHMKNNVEVYKTSVLSNGNYLQQGEFNSQNLSNESFFVWKSEKYKDLISKLLSGKEIMLKADVKKSRLKRDAIKFSFIEFHFRCTNESLQPQLDLILNGFDIVATHMGNSYYRYGNKIYLITSDKQTIVYSFAKNTSGESVRSNAVYEKIRRGDLMLSPYTVWQLKLFLSANGTSFDDLRRFKGDIDLELTGYASYVMNHHLLNLAEEDCRVVEEYNVLDQCLD